MSTFPPERTTTTRPFPGGFSPSKSAAAPAAPAASTTSFDFSIRVTMARAMASSVTVTTSSTSPFMTSKGRSPTMGTAMPSAKVAGFVTRTRSPLRKDSAAEAHPSAWTPTTRVFGLSALTATAMPATSPPPPTGTITSSTGPPASRTISSPTVPCPAITASSS